MPIGCRSFIHHCLPRQACPAADIIPGVDHQTESGFTVAAGADRSATWMTTRVLWTCSRLDCATWATHCSGPKRATDNIDNPMNVIQQLWCLTPLPLAPILRVVRRSGLCRFLLLHGRPNLLSNNLRNQARTFPTTVADSTPVRRCSSPWNLYVSLS